jgi:hypothetical protein
MNEFAATLLKSPIMDPAGIYKQEFDKGQIQGMAAILRCPADRIAQAIDMKEAIDERPSTSDE